MPGGAVRGRLIVTGIVVFSILFSVAAHAEDALTIELKSMSGDFVETGYATAEMSAVFNKDGKPVGGVPVSWKITAVENRSEAMPLSAKNRIEGLSWDHPDRSVEKIGEFFTVTDSTGTVRAKLTDIIGERTVTVAATAAYGGGKYHGGYPVVFGNGPLSIFNAPLPEPVTWLELYETCNGKPYPGTPADWKIGIGRVGGDKMPSLEQMQSISMPSEYNKARNAMAAAVTAGWPTDRRYWNDRAVMQGRASHMDIRNGTHHGSGGNDVKAKEYGACLR